MAVGANAERLLVLVQEKRLEQMGRDLRTARVPPFIGAGPEGAGHLVEG
ncbi:MAG: hypothetical protein V1929_05965 [bacterium]